MALLRVKQGPTLPLPPTPAREPMKHYSDLGTTAKFSMGPGPVGAHHSGDSWPLR